MGDAAAVTEIDGADELLEVLSGEIFGEFSIVDFGEEFTAIDVFHDEEDFSFGGHDFLEFNDVGVADEFHHRHLALDLLDESFLFELLFLDDFDGDALVGVEVSAVVDFGEVSLAQDPPHLVLVQDYASRVRGELVFRIHRRTSIVVQ